MGSLVFHSERTIKKRGPWQAQLIHSVFDADNNCAELIETFRFVQCVHSGPQIHLASLCSRSAAATPTAAPAAPVHIAVPATANKPGPATVAGAALVTVVPPA